MQKIQKVRVPCHPHTRFFSTVLKYRTPHLQSKTYACDPAADYGHIGEPLLAHWQLQCHGDAGRRVPRVRGCFSLTLMQYSATTDYRQRNPGSREPLTGLRTCRYVRARAGGSDYKAGVAIACSGHYENLASTIICLSEQSCKLRIREPRLSVLMFHGLPACPHPRTQSAS